MFCFPLTNWITMRGGAGIASITQSESQWLDLLGFEDVVAWLQCQERTLANAASINLTYQTAPTKDESLFVIAGAPTTIALAAASAPVVTKIITSSAAVPLARWLRWQLAPSNGASVNASWDATFRIWIAANIGPHPLRPKTPFPPTRQSGKSCNGDCQKGGSTPTAGRLPPARDIPPAGNIGRSRPGIAGPTPNGAPVIGRPTMSNTSGMPYTQGSPYSRMPTHMRETANMFLPPVIN